jgi:hypothetical protein
VVGEGVEMVGQGHALGLPGLLAEVADQHHRTAGGGDRARHPRDEQVGEQAGVQRPRAEDDQVRAADGRHDRGGGRRRVGLDPDPLETRGDGHRDLPGDLQVGGPRVQGDRHRGAGQHAPRYPEQARHPVQRVDDVPGREVLQRDEHQVAEAVTGQFAPWEAVLEQLGQLAVLRQRGQRHPQVAGRHDVEVAAQPTGRAAVVSDRDHGRDVVDHPGQRVERARQSVAPADGHGAGPVPRSGAHSRPRSRCSTATLTSSAVRRR